MAELTQDHSYDTFQMFQIKSFNLRKPGLGRGRFALFIYFLSVDLMFCVLMEPLHLL